MYSLLAVIVIYYVELVLFTTRDNIAFMRLTYDNCYSLKEVCNLFVLFL